MPYSLDAVFCNGILIEAVLIFTACLATVQILNQLKASYRHGAAKSMKGKLSFILSMATFWQQRGIRTEFRFVYMCVCACVCMCVCLGVYILQKNDVGKPET